MDTLAGLNFGAVIALNIQALGVTAVSYTHLDVYKRQPVEPVVG